MDPSSLKQLLSLPVGLYIGGVILGQIILSLVRRAKRERLKDRRRKAGLNDQVLVDHSFKLETLREQAIADALVLIATLVALPIVLANIFKDDAGSLGATFLAMFVWSLVTAMDVAKAFLGGLAFRALVGARHPFQVGDRVTLQGYSGKVEEIGLFFVRMKTLNEELVSIPTASLWNAPIVSANAGDKASLCVMTFYLSPHINAKLRKAAEQAIWDAIQGSVYWDFGKPMQIYVEQGNNGIVLTAQAYVASTYNEPLFKSDVYRAFLDFADRESVPLAPG